MPDAAEEANARANGSHVSGMSRRAATTATPAQIETHHGQEIR